MKKTLHYFLLTALAVLFFTESHAQSWQWGKRGGSASASVNAGDWETVMDMCTDKHGNVYTLSRVHQSSLNVDNHSLTGYGGTDIAISSFSCDGSYRWSKIIGANGNSDRGAAIRTDTLGGVYVTGYMFLYTYTGHIDVDTTISSTYKSFFIVKFDTAGVYKWLRMPQADTVGQTAFSNTGPMDMDVDDIGNSYTLCILPSGAYANGAFVANTAGVYILKYNAAGAFIGGIKPDLTVAGGSGLYMRMVRSHNTGSYYFGGAAGPLIGGSIYFNNVLFTHGMYIAKFNSQGQFQWVKNNTGNGSNFLGPIALDAHSNVYASGIVYSGDTFNTVPINSSSFSMPIAVSLDSNGNNRWVKWDNTSTSDGGRADGVTVRNGNELALIGHYLGSVSWPGYTGPLLHHINNQLSDIFVTRFNSADGSPLAIDSLGSTAGYRETPTAITADKRGNVYIGGQFAADLRVAGDTLQNIGGETDFFVAKYGCNCAPAIANYTYVVNNHTVNYTYTGPMPVDSLVWHFGDASTATTTTATTSHNYAGGSFNVCVTAYTPCDSNTYCQQVQVAVGVEQLSMNDVQVSVWPNPMDEDLTLALSEGQGTRSRKEYAVSFSDVTGRVLINTTVNSGSPTSIHIPGLARGIYFVTVSDPARGMKITRKVVKE